VLLAVPYRAKLKYFVTHLFTVPVTPVPIHNIIPPTTSNTSAESRSAAPPDEVTIIHIHFLFVRGEMFYAYRWPGVWRRPLCRTPIGTGLPTKTPR
jgi:hypothetical protein